jgi:UDP-N-acetylglucosamine 2-epimerase (non-hydrolysing)
MTFSDVVLIFGTRPSYIKLWPVYRALVAEGLMPRVICTGQHVELVRQHQAVIDMPIHEDLDVMRLSRSLNDTIRLVLERVGWRLQDMQPRLVVVNGDHASSLGTALAAFHQQIPVAHVEAGLRSGNIASPYPEEGYRVMIDAIASPLYAPTARAAEAARQTHPIGVVNVTGNPVVDSVKAMIPHLDETMMAPEIPSDRPYIVLDLHRRESFGPPLAEMVAAVCAAGEAHETGVYWPVHPNPSVQQVATSWEKTDHGCLRIGAPLPYTSFLATVRHAALVVTDSGSVVEEACSLGTPTLQLRDETERHEAIPTFSWLVGREPAAIEKLVGEALSMADRWKRSLVGRANPFGAGDAGQTIARHIKEWLDKS